MPKEIPISDLPVADKVTTGGKLLMDDGNQSATTSLINVGQHIFDNSVNFKLVDGKYLQLRDFTKAPDEPGYWRGIEVFNGSLAATASAAKFIGADKDTVAYVNLTNSSDIEGIDSFIKGAKNLGLWDHMICWPMREGQNSGSGLTVYALGGLMGIGGANGILETLGTPPGLPLWRTDGVEFSGTKVDSNFWPQNYMVSSSFPFNTSCTFYCVINFDFAGLNTDVSSVTPVIMNARPSNPNALYHFPRRVGLYRTSQTPIASPVNPNSHRYGVGLGQFFGPAQQSQFNGPIAIDDNNNWAAAGMSYALGDQLYSRNGGNFSNGNLVQNPSYPIINEDYIILLSTIQRPVDGFRGIGASYFWFNVFLDQQQHTDFYNLYKNTLGRGLGLP